MIEDPSAISVSVGGSFNNWDMNAFKLEKDETGVWRGVIDLPAGDYEYKFVFNGADWIPVDNQKFSLIKKEDRLFLNGGKGFSVWFNKRSNFKLSDKIILSVYEKFTALPTLGRQHGTNSPVAARNILEVTPQIFINDNVFLTVVLPFDYPEMNVPGVWRTKLDLRSDLISMTIFNNEHIRMLQDPVGSLDAVQYSSGYAVFDKPIQFFDAETPQSAKGYNLRGLTAASRMGMFALQGSLVHPSFSEEDIGTLSFSMKKRGSSMTVFGLMRRGYLSGNTYPVLDGLEWFSGLNGKGRYKIDPDHSWLGSQEFKDYRSGFFVKWKGHGPASVFGECLGNMKEGGFYTETKLSDGSDLPADYSNYSAGSRVKNVRTYSAPYHGYSGALGFQLDFSKAMKIESMVKVENKSYDIAALAGVRSMLISASANMRSDLKDMGAPVVIALSGGYIVGDKAPASYAYGLFLDEYDLYHVALPGCDERIDLRAKVSVEPDLPVKFGVEARYSKYGLRDIYFDTGKKWNDETASVIAQVDAALPAGLSFDLALRTKHYDMMELVESFAMLTYVKDFIDPSVWVNWKYKDNMKLGVGVGPDLSDDERHREGFHYLLNGLLDARWPSFKTAEEFFGNNIFLGVKGEMTF